MGAAMEEEMGEVMAAARAVAKAEVETAEAAMEVVMVVAAMVEDSEVVMAAVMEEARVGARALVMVVAQRAAMEVTEEALKVAVGWGPLAARMVQVQKAEDFVGPAVETAKGVVYRAAQEGSKVEAVRKAAVAAAMLVAHLSAPSLRGLQDIGA